MKTSRLFLLLLLIAIFSSCGSDKEEPQPNSSGFLRFKSNGVQKEFPLTPSQLMSFSYDPTGKIYFATFLIIGPGGDGTKNFVSATIRNEVIFTTGVDYKMQDLISYQGAKLVRIQFTYADEEGRIFNAVLEQRNIPGIRATDDARFRFTTITQNSVEGNFDALLLGPFSNLTGRGNTELPITEGQFRMPLINQIP